MTRRAILRPVLRLFTTPLRLARGVLTTARGTDRLTARAAEHPAGNSDTHAPASRQIRRALTQLLARRPGVTVAQAANELDVDSTALYPPIWRLEAAGALVKLGRELHPPR